LDVAPPVSDSHAALAALEMSAMALFVWSRA
jgi:hypothetical protein